MTHIDRKALTVRIRLHGTATELTAALAALTRVLDIHRMSRPYLDRPPSTHHRIYLHATPREDPRP